MDAAEFQPNLLDSQRIERVWMRDALKTRAVLWVDGMPYLGKVAKVCVLEDTVTISFRPEQAQAIERFDAAWSSLVGVWRGGSL